MAATESAPRATPAALDAMLERYEPDVIDVEIDVVDPAPSRKSPVR